jgi:transcription antitermination factor NusG
MPRQAAVIENKGIERIFMESTDPEQLPWYVIMVRSNHEKRIAQALSDRGIDHFLPCYQSIRQWKDRRVTLELPLFPGYVFVRICLNVRLRVLTIPHVFSLLGTGSSFSTVPEEEINAIRQGVKHGKAEPHPYLTAGQQVVVTQGPMCGITGILLRQQSNTRMVISVRSIARSFVLDVDSACVQPLINDALSVNDSLASDAFRRDLPARLSPAPGNLPVYVERGASAGF